MVVGSGTSYTFSLTIQPAHFTISIIIKLAIMIGHFENPITP